MLHGRGAECAVVDDLLDAARARHSDALVLRGEAGIGKSALLSYAAQRATDMRVATCIGIESESDLPFAGLHQLLRPVISCIDVIPARQQSALRAAFGDGPVVAADQFLVSLAVLQVLAEAAEAQPLLCLIDDAQWLDSASANALRFAARRVHAEGIALLFAARDDPLRQFAAAGVRELRLVGLASDAATALLAERAAVPVCDAVRDRLVADTLGNPLGLRELATALSDDQLLGRSGLPERLPVGTAVEQLFLDRVRRLGADTQQLLLIAAVDSGELPVTLQAAQLLGIDAGALGAAEQADLVTTDDAAISFRHPLVRSAVYRGATSEERRVVQHALAAALDGDRQAWLLANAATGPDPSVADALRDVGDRARHRSAHAAAAAAFERAAALTPDPAARAVRLTDAADASWQAGEPDRARRLLERAAPLAVEVGVRARIAHLRGSIEGRCGAPDAAYATLVGAASLVAGTDPALAARVLTEAGQAAWIAGDVDRLKEAADRLTDLASSGETLAAHIVTGLASFLTGDTATASLRLREAARLADSTDDTHALTLAATAAMFTADDARAIDLYTRAVASARAASAASTLATVLAPLSALEAMTNRFTAALADASEGLRLAHDTGQLNPAAHLRSVLAWIAALQGREDDCRSEASAALSHAVGQRVGPAAAIGTWALALADLGAGRRSEAFDRLAALTFAGPGESHQMVSMLATADFVEAAARTERADAAGPALARLDAWSVHTGAAWVAALSARCRGLVSGDASHFEDALRLHAAAGRPFDTARTQLVYGESLRRRRKRADARKHLRSALEAFELLGALPWAEQARVELLATGETARKRSVDTLQQLTPQELQIVRFVGQGATNKAIAAQLFLSTRTVDYHLRKVFAKLGVNSRHELVRLSLTDAPVD